MFKFKFSSWITAVGGFAACVPHLSSQDEDRPRPHTSFSSCLCSPLLCFPHARASVCLLVTFCLLVSLWSPVLQPQGMCSTQRYHKVSNSKKQCSALPWLCHSFSLCRLTSLSHPTIPLSHGTSETISKTGWYSGISGRTNFQPGWEMEIVARTSAGCCTA